MIECCPSCDRDLDPQQINAKIGIGLCLHCDAVYTLEKIRTFQLSDYKKTLPLMMNVYQQSDHVWINVVAPQPISKGNEGCLYLLFCVAFLVIMASGTFRINGVYYGWVLKLILLAVLGLISLPFLYSANKNSTQTYEIDISPQYLFVYQQKKLGVRKRIFNIPTSEIDQLYVKNLVATGASNNKWEGNNYSLVVVKKDYEEVPLIVGENLKIQLEYCENLIENYLNLKDRKMDG